MKKLLSIFFIILLPILNYATVSFAALNPVTSTRSDNATDQANGVQFDDLGDWTLTVIDGDSLGSTGGISANNQNQDKYDSTLDFAGNSTTPGTIGPPSHSAANLKINNTGSSSGKVAIFNGNVSVDNVDITTAGEMDFNGNLTGNASSSISYTAAGTIQMADGKSITGFFSTNANNQGTLTFLGTSSVSGVIGSSAVLDLNTINANGGSGKTVTLSGTTYTDILNFGGDGTVNLADTKNLTTGTGITTSTTGTGTLTAVGTSTLAGPIGLTGARLKAVNGGAAGATTTFSNDIFAVTTNVTGSGTMALNGNLTGTTLDFNAAGATGAVNLADTKDITAAVTTQTTDTGTLTSLGTNTIIGQVGTSDNKLTVVNGGAAGKTTTFANDIYATTTNVTGAAGTIALGGNLTSALAFGADGTVTVADGKNIMGAVSTGGVNQGTLIFLGASTTSSAIGATLAANRLTALNVNGGSVTLGSNIFATTTTVNSGGTLSLSGNRAIEGNLTLAGTGILDLGTNTLTMDSAGPQIVTAGAATVIKTTLNSSAARGNIAATAGIPAVTAGTTVNAHVAGTLTSGASIKILDGAAGGADTAVNVTTNSGRYSMVGAYTAATGDITITPTFASPSAITSSSNASNVGTVLDSIAATATGDMATIENTLSTLSAADYDAAVKQLTPDVNAAVTQGSMAAMTHQVNVVGTHMEEFRNIISAGKSGISTGDDYAGSEYRISGVWAKGFTNFGDQKDRQGFNGYDSSLWGMVFGLDGLDTEKFCLGTAFGYARSNIDTKNISATMGIDSYQGTLYASYYADEPWYVDGSLSFGWNQYNGRRPIIFGGLHRVAESSYDGQQYGAKIGGGYNFKRPGGWVVTPMASLEAIHLHLQSYAETDALDLSLEVDEQDYDVVQSGLGVKIAYPFTDDRGTFEPEIHGKWLYDFIGDKQQTTSTFTGGGTSFATNGFTPAQNSFDLGAGLTYLPKSSLWIQGVYDMDVKSDYIGHSGTLTLHYNF